MSSPVMVVDSATPFTGVGRYTASLFRLPNSNDLLRHVRLDRKEGCVRTRTGYDDGDILSLREIPGRQLPPSLWNMLAGRTLPVGGMIHLSTQNLSRLGRGRRRIVTVHDLFYRTCPRNASDPLLGMFLYGGLPGCDLALCDSQETADSLQRLYRMPEDRIRVVPLFVDPLRFPEESDAPAPWNVRPFLLHVSSEEPRKKFETVLRGFAELSRIPAFGDHALVKIGRASHPDFRTSHEELCRQLGITDRVFFLDQLDDPSLGALYRRAHALLMPSSAEGFGFPLLEAMGQGCPVVAGDIGALREIGGNAVRYVQPDDPAGLAGEAESLPADGQERESLRKACLEQAALFSRNRFLSTMSEIYSDWG